VELKVLKEPQDIQEHKVRVGAQVLKVHKVPLVVMDHKVHKEAKVLKVQ
jgi:hypothetical protein